VIRIGRRRARPPPGARAWPALACALGAVLAFLLGAGPVWAQTSIELVSNHGKPRHATVSLEYFSATPFTTGSHAAGYKLTGVGIVMQYGWKEEESPSYSVTIHAASSGRPGALLATLTNPQSLSRGYKSHSFAVPGSGIELAANTTYWVVISAASEGDNRAVVGVTYTFADDPGAAAGWSVGNKRLWRTDSRSWDESPGSLMLALRGHRIDTVAPTAHSASVNGAALKIAFSEPLERSSVPSGSSFSVLLDGDAQTPTAVSVMDRTVTLTLAQAATARQTAFVIYTKPDQAPLWDLGKHNQAAGFEVQAANITADRRPPALQGVFASGDVIDVVYDELLDLASVPSLTNYRYTDLADTSPRPTWRIPRTVRVIGTRVALTLDAPVTAGQRILLLYSPEFSPPEHPRWVKDRAGNRVAGFNNVATNLAGDATPPAVASASVDGTLLKIIYDEVLDAGSVPAKGSFSVEFRRDGQPATSQPATSQTPAAVYLTGKTVLLRLGTAAGAGDAVRLTYTKPAANPIRDLSGNEAAALDQAVANAAADTTPPAVESASVDGSTLSIVFDELLDSAVLPSPGAFFVSVDGGAGRSPAAAAVAGKTVTLALNRAAAHGESVTVSYLRLTGYHKLRDVAGNAASFAGQTVRNVTGPVVTGGSVDRAALTLSFDGALDTASVPAPGDFSVRVTGNTPTESTARAVAVRGRELVLTIRFPAVPGDSVDVTYARGAAPLRAADGLEVKDFTAAVTNVSAPATPVVRGASVDGAALAIVFNESLDGGSVPAPLAFAVSVDGGAAKHPDRVVVDGTTVRLTLATAVTHGQVVAVRYQRPAQGLRLSDRSLEEVASFTEVVDNVTKPVVTAARTAVDGRSVALTFDAALDGASVPAPGAFTVSVDGTARTPGGVALDGATVTLALGAAVAEGAAVTVAYAAPDAGALQDPAGLAVAGFSGRVVENVTDVTAPAFTSAATAADGGSVVVTFDEALDGGSVPAPGEFGVSVDGGAAQVPGGVALDGATVTLTLIDAVTHGQAVTVSYAKPAQDALRDRTGNAVASFSGREVINATPDPEAPVVTGVAIVSDAGPDQTYALGQRIRVWLTFDQAVHVAGAPRLRIALRGPTPDAGGGERWAPYESGSGSTVLAFAYQVAAADRSTLGVAVLADTLEANGGTIRSVAGNVDAVPAHAGLGQDAKHRVDGSLAAAPVLKSAGVNGAGANWPPS